MRIQVLTYEQIEREEWGALVRRSETGTWFQSPEAYAFYASMPELMVPFAVAVVHTEVDGPSEDLRGVCVGYVTLERSSIRQYFTRRAIIIGGPCIANDATDEEVTALMAAVRTELTMGNRRLARSGEPIYIETRNFNDFSRWRGAFAQAGEGEASAQGFVYQPHLNFHMDCTDAEGMWLRLSETRRRQIKRARATGVEMEVIGNNNSHKRQAQKEENNMQPDEQQARQDERDIAAWYAILAELYRTKVKTPLFPLAFFLAFYRQGRGLFLIVKHEGKVIGGMMCPVLERTCLYEWFVCGLDAEYKDQYPSVMATWAAMEYANGLGIPRFDIMGAGVPGVPYGVRDFKAEFGGRLVEYGRFLHVNKPWLYRIGKAAVAIVKRKQTL